ncbi:molecular chaperone [Shewanella algae]|uniref:fimbrial biogenesis chaperone n=1 Tax=Shewanella algae TaxID=38313 RepID=UPI0030C87D41
MVLTGTRVIYPGNAKDHSIQLLNRDNFPNVVQLWMDIDNPESTPETADAPFVLLPAVFKVPANGGQTVRILYTGTALPQDRESVFYLNSLQIPPSNKADSSNKMLVMLRNRNKVFYRPESLTVSPNQVPSMLAFSLHHDTSGLQLEVHNPSPYFASFSQASLQVNERLSSIPVAMVAPFSRTSWPVTNLIVASGSSAQLKFTLINDQGAQITQEREIR